MSDQQTRGTITGAEMIAVERQRQIEAEGWAPGHDAMHDGGELAVAAACYAVEGTYAETVIGHDLADAGKDAWPWAGWDKRKKHDRLRRLVIAGALIAAEIDRELRRASKHGTSAPTE